MYTSYIKPYPICKLLGAASSDALAHRPVPATLPVRSLASPPQYTTAFHREHGFRATLPPAVSAAPQWAQVRGEEAAGSAAAEARR